jgi:non-specific protein-tyrosine kinase
MELKEVIAPLKKWWWLLLASTLVATTSSFFAVQQQPLIYRTSATLIIGRTIDNPNPSGAEFYLSQQLAETYATLANRTPVRQATMQTLGIDWLPEYTVRTINNTQLIEITVTDTSPERAQVVANELINQIILQSPSGLEREDLAQQEFIKGQLADLQEQILQTSEEINTKEAELGTLFSARQIADSQGQIAGLQTKLNALQANYAALLSNTREGSINTLEIFEYAPLPQNPVGVGKITTILTAAVIGFTLAAGAAYLLEYLDDTLKTPEDVSKIVGLPTLAGIAHVKENEGEPNLITQTQPRSPIAEAFRVLRTGIRFANIDKPNQTLLVTSANPTEGKSMTAANLATVIAQADNRVILVDADLRRPTQHKLFQLSNGQGLSNLLLDLDVESDASYINAVIDLSLQSVETTKNLFVLTCGATPPNPSELLGSAKMKSLINILSKKFDYVIIDSPPVLAVTDAVILSTQVDSVLLVIDAGKTRRNQFKQAVDRLKEVRANIVGVTLNRLSPRNGGHYYHYYYHKSYYRDQAETPPAKETFGVAQNGYLNGTAHKKETKNLK